MREAADAAVEAHREEQWAAGVQVKADVGWTMDGVPNAAKARLRDLARSMARLQDARLAMVHALWLDAVEPAMMSRL